MADEDYIAPSNGSSTEEDKQNAEHSSPEDWKQLTGNKFKTEAELAKGYKELEKKFGESSDEVRKSREFAEVINPLLEEIRNDPEVFNKLDEKLRKKGQPTNPPATDTNKDGKMAELNEMRDVTSEIVLAKFEEQHGISKLSPDEKKDMRRKIGDTILEITGSTLPKIDLRRLGSVLENAWFLANKDQLVDKSKLEALASSDSEEASISSIPSSSKKGESTLTPEEAKMADRLGLTRDQYIAGKKKV